MQLTNSSCSWSFRPFIIRETCPLKNIYLQPVLGGESAVSFVILLPSKKMYNVTGSKLNGDQCYVQATSILVVTMEIVI